MVATAGERAGDPHNRTTPDRGTGESTLGFERVVFFSDAVFAIVITLLVLPLTAEVELPEGEGSLASRVLTLWPTALTFAVSFLVVGQFWMAHHRTFGLLVRHDDGLIWLNLVTLLTVAFMPFPAALLGSQSTAESVFPVVFFAASMTVASAALTATWLYAVRHDLTVSTLTPAEKSRVTVRALTTTTVFAVSIAAALLGLLVAVAFWLGVLPIARLLVQQLRRGSPQRPDHSPRSA